MAAWSALRLRLRRHKKNGSTGSRIRSSTFSGRWKQGVVSLRLSHPSSRGLHHHHRLHRYRSTRAERNLSARKSASAGGASNFSLPTFSPIPLGICCSISTRPVTIGGRRSEEHASELQSLMRTPYAVFCFTKKTTQ